MDDGYGYVPPGWSKLGNVKHEQGGYSNGAPSAQMYYGCGGARNLPAGTTSSTPSKYVPLSSHFASDEACNLPAYPSPITAAAARYYGQHYAGYTPLPDNLPNELSQGGSSNVKTFPVKFRGSGRRGHGGASFRGGGQSQKFYGYSGNIAFGTMNNGSSQTRSRKDKPYQSSGKTAAMILNELYPDFKDHCSCDTLMDMKVPRFEFKFSIQGRQFSADASSKRIAKQLACERALKILRPDIVLDVPSHTESEALKKESVMETNSVKGSETSVPSKKKKRDPLTTSNSLPHYFLRLCQEKEAETKVRYNPEFSFCELPVASGAKQHMKRFQCTLTMLEQGKVYTHEGVGKAAGKNSVIREALLDVFKISPEEMRTIERRVITLRPGPPVAVLLQALSFYDRPVHIEVDTADGKPLEANSRFIAKITIDNETTITGPEEDSKQKAKDAACLKVLTDILELSMPEPEEFSLKRASSILSPCYALHHLLGQQNRLIPPDLKYEEPFVENLDAGKVPIFKCVLTVNGKETFEGFGKSKKAAKTDAAEKALKKIFNLDLQCEDALERVQSKRMKSDEALEFCSEISEFVRGEYERICIAQGCPLTTYIAAFVLISPDGARRMVSLGTGRNWVIDGQLLRNSKGAVLVHMQSIVLARRAFLLFIHKQLEMINDPNCVLERSEQSSKYHLKAGYKVILYSAFAPNGGHRTSGVNKANLTCHMGNTRAHDVPENVQTMNEIYETGKVNVMSAADKILKWNYLGVQGALLSYLVEPIYITHLFIGTSTADSNLMYDVLLRFGDARKDDLIVKSAEKGIKPQGEMYHNWVDGIGTIERLDPATGRTVTGSLSRLCKSELFESWSRLLNTLNEDIKTSTTCAEAKRHEYVYMNVLSNFIAQLKALGLGEWQRKDQSIDSFQLVSFDE